MSHGIRIVNNRWDFAFTGERSAIWHKGGNQVSENATDEEWQEAAGYNFEILGLPTYYRDGNGDMRIIPGRVIPARSDTYEQFGDIVSNNFKIVQPRVVHEWFTKYISVDSRFKLSAMGVLSTGVLWATAKYNGDFTIAGDHHTAYVLMSTGSDGKTPTKNQMTMTRSVCKNTLAVSWSDSRACVTTKHNTYFDPQAVAEELAALAQSVDSFKAAGDALAEKTMESRTISNYFKSLLNIPFDAKEEDVSTRSMNMFSDLNRAYKETLAEGTRPNTAWAALNAVTRYVDHDRTVRGGDGEARFMSTQLVNGSGAKLKQQAVKLLTNDDLFAELLKQPLKTRGTAADISAVLKQPLLTRA